jgi:hypothetical protein
MFVDVNQSPFEKHVLCGNGVQYPEADAATVPKTNAATQIITALMA